jgi:hypothetical protein
VRSINDIEVVENHFSKGKIFFKPYHGVCGGLRASKTLNSHISNQGPFRPIFIEFLHEA